MSFGVIVSTRTTAPSATAVVNTGTLFVCGKTASGPLTAVSPELRSIDDWAAIYGGRTGTSIPTYDYLDAFFQEGGGRAFFAPYATNYGDALTLLNDPTLGPGQLAVVGTPGATTVFADMHAAAVANNRVALRDGIVSDTVTSLAAIGAQAPVTDEYGATFGPWQVIPPPTNVAGASARQVPASAIVAALCARVDADGNPNRAASGPDYPIRFATGGVIPVADADRSTLFLSGVNSFNLSFGTYQGYGFQTNLTSGPADPYWQFNCARGRMYLAARCKFRGAAFMFRPIDGQGLVAGALQSALEEELKALFDVGGLYGDVPEDAYSVNVSSSVNTTTTIAQGQLHAVAEVVWSMHARAVMIDLVTVPIGSPVG